MVLSEEQFLDIFWHYLTYFQPVQKSKFLYYYLLKHNIKIGKLKNEEVYSIAIWVSEDIYIFNLYFTEVKGWRISRPTINEDKISTWVKTESVNPHSIYLRDFYYYIYQVIKDGNNRRTN